MTAQTRSALKGVFEQGDKPQGTDYVDLIDSFLSLSDASAQSITSPLTISGTLGAQAVTAASLGVTSVSATNIQASIVSASSITATDISADSLWLAGLKVETGVSAARCEVFIEATATAVISAAGGFSIIPGAVSADSSVMNDFSASTTLMQATYIGSQTAVFHAVGHFSVEDGNNKLLGFTIGKNAAPLTKAEQQRFIATGTDIGAASTGSLVSLVSGDTVSLMATNRTDTTDLVFRKAILVVTEA